MQLTLIISSLTPGGAQRVLVTMANYWAGKDWSITLLTFDDGKKDSFFDLHPKIKHFPLGIASNSSNIIQGIINNLKRVLTIRQAIKKSAPKAVISFLGKTNILVLLASIGLNLPVIISERSIPVCESFSRVWDTFRNWVYLKSFRLVVQNQSVFSYFSKVSNVRVKLIPNPVTTYNGHNLDSKESPCKKAKVLLAMGRLSKEKGFDILVKAFSQLVEKYPHLNLVIWGEGSEREALEYLRDDLGLRSKVQFPGVTRFPIKEMKKADLFILSSRYEGFPNVLCEAMACGLPVISFDCPSGPKEIIRNGIDGILVPPENIEALTAAIDSLLEDKKKRDRLAMRAPEVIDRFGLKKVMKMWENIIFSAIKT